MLLEEPYNVVTERAASYKVKVTGEGTDTSN